MARRLNKNLMVDLGKDTANRFVADSWFGGQGEPVHVIAYDLWARGWVPAKQ